MDPKIAAEEYLEKQSIRQLFSQIGTALFQARPSDPTAFVVDFLEEMRAGVIKRPSYTDNDLEGMFSILDPSSSNKVTVEQYRQAMAAAGYTVLQPGHLSQGLLDKETFMRLAREVVAHTRPGVV
mmetsp:Transcript_2182/g.3319  ORF Transcript_2182/g.3319 Transcript_2182/m.3319 type:complete len:125 (+) Transcript_2182:1246-1620(+)